MISTQQSVGKTSPNLIKDLRQIQLALLQTGFLTPKDFNNECLDLTVETPVLDAKDAILAGDIHQNWLEMLEGKSKVGERQIPATIAAIIKFQKEVIHLPQPDGRVDPNGRTIRQLSVLAEKKIKERAIEEATDIALEGDKITISVRADRSKTTKILSLQACRDFLTKTWNWNGIVKLMHWLYEANDEKYLLPNNLSGASSDDILIIPNQAVLYIIEIQLKYAIEKVGLKPENLATILRIVDGLAGNTFITKIIKAKSKTDYFDETNNERLTRIEDDAPIIIPGLDTDQETLYQFFRDMVRARNGLWSDMPGVVNVVGFRRILDDSNKTEYNDTLAVCWLHADENGFLCPNVEVNIASTEPGSRVKSRQLVPQTMTLVAGYHHVRQPGGRTRNAVKMGKNQGALVWSQGDTTMNFHQGSNNFDYPGSTSDIRRTWLWAHGIQGQQQHGFPSDGFDETALRNLNLIFSETYLVLSQYGLDGSQPPYKNMSRMADAPEVKHGGIKDGKITLQWSQNGNVQTKIINVADAKKWLIQNWTRKKKPEEQNKFTLILKKIKVLDDEKASKWTEMKKADLMAAVTDQHILQIVETQIKYTADPNGIDGLAGNSFVKMIAKVRQSLVQAKRDKTRVDELFTQLPDYPLKNIPGLIQKIKTHFQLNTDKHRWQIQQLTKELPNFEVDVIQHATVGSYSLGCQIIYDTEVFYTFWTNLLMRAAKVGQLRWYYTLIDATDLKQSELIA